VNTASKKDVATVLANIKTANPRARVIMADSPVFVSEPKQIKGKKVLVVEDGPTLTHGEMKYGAGHIAAKKFGAKKLVDPHPYAVGSIKKTFAKYTHVTEVLPAMGYGQKQMKELERTINAVPCDLVLIGTPIDLGRMLKINKPSLRVTYELEERTPGKLAAAVKAVL
jgi:predicted GTPase